MGMEAERSQNRTMKKEVVVSKAIHSLINGKNY